MKQNSQLHISIGTDFLLLLKKRADEKGICLSEYCRQKLREGYCFEKIEFMLNKLFCKHGN